MPIPLSAPGAERRLLRDTVREQIRRAILDGTLESGERLHDEQLIAWLGVSRTPLREALGDLTRAGLIEMSPNRYTRVAVPQVSEALDALQTLGVLFGGAVRLAVPHLQPKVVEQIIETIAACQDALASGDGPALNAHAVALFATYVQHCGNKSLKIVCEDVTDGLAYKLRLPEIVQILDWDRLSPQFTELQNATIAGDPIAAELAAEAIHQLPGRRAA